MIPKKYETRFVIFVQILAKLFFLHIEYHF